MTLSRVFAGVTLRSSRLILVLATATILSPAAVASAQSSRPRGCASSEDADACYRRGLQLAIESLRSRRESEETTGKSAGDRDALWTRAESLSKDALALLNSACSRGVGDSCYFAGKVTATLGKPSNFGDMWPSFQNAVDMFRKGCVLNKKQSGAACNSLADSYKNGIGVAIQPDSALVYAREGCELGDATACYRWGSWVGDSREFGVERAIPAVKISTVACANFSPTGCMNLAFHEDTALNTPGRDTSAAARREIDRIVAMYRRGCGLGIATACSNIGGIFDRGRYPVPASMSVAQRDDSAHLYWTMGCNGGPNWQGAASACTILGNEAIRRHTSADTANAIGYYRQACVLLIDRDACAKLGLNEYLSKAKDIPPFLALHRVVTSCVQGSAEGCNYAGWFFQQDRFRDQEQSLLYFRRACGMDYAWSCYRLSDIETDLSRKTKYARRACQLQEERGCLGLAGLLEEKLHFPQQALTYFAKACDLGNGGGCWSAKRMSRARGDELSEGFFRARACSYDATYCKKSDKKA